MVATTSVPDQRGPGLPHIVITQLLDAQGCHWEKYGDDEPVRIGIPPEKP
jgi:hypothetical protein